MKIFKVYDLRDKREHGTKAQGWSATTQRGPLLETCHIEYT